MKSSETTWAGILQFLAIASTQIGTLFDGNLATNPEWGLIISSLVVLIGLIRARDNNVTSKAAGAEK